MNSINRKNILRITVSLGLLFFTSACGSGSLSVSVPTASESSIGFSSSSGEISSSSVSMKRNTETDNLIYLDVVIKSDSVFGASLTIIYDPEKINWAGSYEKGTFLEQSGSPAYLLALDSLEGEGKLVAGVSLTGSSPAANGEGTLVTIPFEIIQKGSSEILFDPSSKILDSTGSELSIVTWSGGTITVL